MKTSLLIFLILHENLQTLKNTQAHTQSDWEGGGFNGAGRKTQTHHLLF